MKPSPAIAFLREALAELDDLVRSRSPATSRGLRPRLLRRQIDRLMAPLAPLRLPDDLRTVYEWHDGCDELTARDYPLLDDVEFLSLETAIKQYRFQMEFPDHWNPLWFPAFGTNSGAFVELTATAAESAGPVWGYYSDDAEITTDYDSILALVLTAIELWKESGAPDAVDGWPNSIALRRANNPLSYDSTGRPRRTLSRIGTVGWPAAWLTTAGVGEMSAGPDDRVVTIREFIDDPRLDRSVRATLHVRSGSGAWVFGALSDGTGTIDVLMLQDHTENFREIAGGIRVEALLGPISDIDPPMPLSGADVREAVDPRIRNFYPDWIFDQFDHSFRADYLVTKLIPL